MEPDTYLLHISKLNQLTETYSKIARCIGSPVVGSQMAGAIAQEVVTAAQNASCELDTLLESDDLRGMGEAEWGYLSALGDLLRDIATQGVYDLGAIKSTVCAIALIERRESNFANNANWKRVFRALVGFRDSVVVR
ncbi:hypothetical protein VJ923_09645 [Adlercreutzia sp. R25]|uniref:hypothetical protein n=1 Tax=Adlercreutzia shanghongiae TaxID=3111773 RepID=UPI002DBB8374|nr:hypothetical protein [Adlercreutzia sp. R25]MEC4273418.1 hypothetical protein [Adlercreutzia sp. R25]